MNFYYKTKGIVRSCRNEPFSLGEHISGIRLLLISSEIEYEHVPIIDLDNGKAADRAVKLLDNRGYALIKSGTEGHSWLILDHLDRFIAAYHMASDITNEVGGDQAYMRRSYADGLFLVRAFSKTGSRLHFEHSSLSNPKVLQFTNELRNYFDSVQYTNWMRQYDQYTGLNDVDRFRGDDDYDDHY